MSDNGAYKVQNGNSGYFKQVESPIEILHDGSRGSQV